MKKTIWIIVLIAIIGAGYFFWHKKPTDNTPAPITETTEPAIKTFISADQSITLKYPENLSVSQKNNIITLHHYINFPNKPACDFKGDAATSTTFTDFHTTIQMFNMTVASTAVAVDPTTFKNPDYISNDVLKINPGFIETYTNGLFSGYKLLQSVEGCGKVTYFLPISSARTLVISKDLVGAFSDIASPELKQKILSQPGSISPTKSEDIFTQIIQSLTIR